MRISLAAQSTSTAAAIAADVDSAPVQVSADPHPQPPRSGTDPHDNLIRISQSVRTDTFEQLLAGDGDLSATSGGCERCLRETSILEAFPASRRDTQVVKTHTQSRSPRQDKALSLRPVVYERANKLDLPL